MLMPDTIKLECQIQKIFLKMISQISTYMVSMVLGIMLFFSFVVAPVTFTVLDEENSRKFIRKIFPYYYTANGVTGEIHFKFLSNIGYIAGF